MKLLIVAVFFVACAFVTTEAVSNQCRTWFKNTCQYYDNAKGGPPARLNSVMQDSVNHFKGECGADQ